MIIPSFDNIKVVDENGYFTPEYRSIFQSLLENLQASASDEGLIMPTQPSANIAFFTNSANGAMVYDSTNNLPKIRVNSSWKTITTY